MGEHGEKGPKITHLRVISVPFAHVPPAVSFYIYTNISSNPKRPEESLAFCAEAPQAQRVWTCAPSPVALKSWTARPPRRCPLISSVRLRSASPHGLGATLALG